MVPATRYRFPIFLSAPDIPEAGSLKLGQKMLLGTAFVPD